MKPSERYQFAARCGKFLSFISVRSRFLGDVPSKGGAARIDIAKIVKSEVHFIPVYKRTTIPFRKSEKKITLLIVWDGLAGHA